VEVVLVPASGHGDVEVLAIQAGAGEGDRDIRGGTLRGVDGLGPPKLRVPREVGGGQGGGAAPGDILHDQAAAVGGSGLDGEPVAVADLVAPIRRGGGVLLPMTSPGAPLPGLGPAAVEACVR
jgi:hypothetical protein